MNNAISDDSPLGAALMGKKKGQIANVEAPDGILRFKILSISRT